VLTGAPPGSAWAGAAVETTHEISTSDKAGRRRST
jgi:hypothetical protein